MKKRIAVIYVLYFSILSQAIYAEVVLADGFGSRMVLQREVPARLTGYANEGEKIIVKLGEQTIAEFIAEGKSKPWSVILPIFKAGPIPDITIEGSNKIVMSDLLAGDVWICSGQSNMEMTVLNGPWCIYGGVLDAEHEVVNATYPEIRLLAAVKGGSWNRCLPETVGQFSATAYFFGRELQRNLKVPIGLISAAVGGTRAEYWIPRTAFESQPHFSESLKEAEKVFGNLNPLWESDMRLQAEWKKEVEEAKKTGKPSPPKRTNQMTQEQMDSWRDASAVVQAGLYYQAKIQGLTSQVIKGVIWYQGESNAGVKSNYEDLLNRLIVSWREGWRQGAFPFIIMQLVNFGGNGTTFSEIRAAQEKVADTVENCHLATGIDVGDRGNIHPKNKQEVGRRLALVALKNVYGLDLVASGPRVKSVKYENGKAILSLDPGGVGQVLVLKAVEKTGFELIDREGKFFPANVFIDESRLVLSSDQAGTPIGVRYAWTDSPEALLFNSVGLPAGPFWLQ